MFVAQVGSVSPLGLYKNCVKINRKLSISIFLNLALLGWIIFLRVMHPRQMTSSTATNAVVTTGALVAQSKAHNFLPQVVPTLRAAAFDWRQVESPVYKEYLA